MGIRLAGRAGALAVVAALALAGCGGDDAGGDDGAATDTEAADDTGDTGDMGDTGEDAPTECVTDAVATFPDDGEIALQDGSAVQLAPSAITVYNGDFAVTADPAGGATAAEGQHLSTVAITTFNSTEEPEPLAAGQEVVWTDDFESQTFRVVLNDGPAALGNNVNAGGTVTIVSLDESSVCLEIDYRDDEKAVSGTLQADIL